MGKHNKKPKIHLPELTRWGRTREQEETELLKLQKEGIIHLEDKRFSKGGISFFIPNDNKKCKKPLVRNRLLPLATYSTTNLKTFDRSEFRDKNRMYKAANYSDNYNYIQELDKMTRYYKSKRENMLQNLDTERELRRLKNEETQKRLDENKNRFLLLKEEGKAIKRSRKHRFNVDRPTSSSSSEEELRQRRKKVSK